MLFSFKWSNGGGLLDSKIFSKGILLGWSFSNYLLFFVTVCRIYHGTISLLCWIRTEINHSMQVFLNLDHNVKGICISMIFFITYVNTYFGYLYKKMLLLWLTMLAFWIYQLCHNPMLDCCSQKALLVLRSDFNLLFFYFLYGYVCHILSP